MLENIKLCQYDVPTPIQQYVLPAVYQNLDVIGVAQTGRLQKDFVTLWLKISQVLGRQQLSSYLFFPN